MTSDQAGKTCDHTNTMKNSITTEQGGPWLGTPTFSGCGAVQVLLLFLLVFVFALARRTATHT